MSVEDLIIKQRRDIVYILCKLRGVRMKRIRKAKFKNHPILKNLELDFCDRNDNAVDTVIFAGENGTGKTTVFNALYELITGGVKMMVGSFRRL